MESEELQGGHEVGGAPPPSWTGGVSPGLHLLQVFFIYCIKISKKFHAIPRTFISVQKNTMVILLKTASVQVSSIEIMQVRVQNKVKSVWKSRYVGDVSMTMR